MLFSIGLAAILNSVYTTDPLLVVCACLAQFVNNLFPDAVWMVGISAQLISGECLLPVS